MMPHKNRKGAGAELLLEIILSTIIFFVVIIVLFAVKLPQLEINAKAHVISADAAVSCELSLTNLLRSTNLEGLSYNDWLVNSYFKKDLVSWQSNVSKVLDTTFSPGYWNLTVNLANGTNITPVLGGITEEGLGVFSCVTSVPYPVEYMKYFCLWNKTESGLYNEQSVNFTTPDGSADCTILVSPDFGVKAKTCNLDLTAKNVFEENFPNTISNTPGILNKITLPVLINGAHYEITINETTEGKQVSVALAKRTSIEDCSLHVKLGSTNISAS
jgi:hypothetical protein